MPVSGFLRAYHGRYRAPLGAYHGRLDAAAARLLVLLLVTLAAGCIALPGAAQVEPVQPVAPESEPQAAPPDPFRQALTTGVALGLIAFAALGIYSWLAPRLRSYAAHLKARRLHRRVERQRRSGRRR